MSEHFRKYIKKDHYPIDPASLRFKTSFTNCIYHALKNRTWKESDHETEWDIYWTEKEWIHDVMDHIHLTPNQRLNHFRNYYELCRKDNLIKNLKRYKKALEKEGKLDDAAAYNFFPTTYNLPTEYRIFCDEFKKSSNHVWIMKPIGKSQGKGIFLFNKLSQISHWKTDGRWKSDNSQVENYIVQRYINDPLLIGGKKFDMRIYCLVTSYSPLVAYLYRDGFARFTHHRYDNDDISNAYVHLTNVAIQKTSDNYDEKIGGKWDLRTLKLYLMSQYGQEAVSKSFTDIQQVIIRSLQCVQKVIMNDKHCFELYGFDILLDAQLKPWLIEVNGSPSMTANTPHDFELKCNLLDDVFTIIDMERVLTGQEEQVGGFDLICKGSPIRNEQSMLGCHNNRAQQTKKLAKSIASKLSQAYIQQQKEEIKKLAEKEVSSQATTDTSSTGKGTGTRIKTKTTTKIGGIPIATKITRVTPVPSVQSTPSQPQQNPSPNPPKEPLKETKEQKESVTLYKPVVPKPKESSRMKTAYSLPPVSPILTSTTTNAQVNAAQSGQTPKHTLSRAATFNLNNPAQKQQPVQSQTEKPSQITPVKPNSALKSSTSLTTGMNSSFEDQQWSKRKSVTNVLNFVGQKPRLYSYDISDRPPSSKIEDKTDRLGLIREPEEVILKEDMKQPVMWKQDIDKLKEENLMNFKRREEYQREMIEDSNMSQVRDEE